MKRNKAKIGVDIRTQEDFVIDYLSTYFPGHFFKDGKTSNDVPSIYVGDVNGYYCYKETNQSGIHYLDTCKIRFISINEGIIEVEPCRILDDDNKTITNYIL